MLNEEVTKRQSEKSKVKILSKSIILISLKTTE